MTHNKFDLIPCECGRCLRHRTAEQAMGCRTCKQDKTNAAAKAAIEWAKAAIEWAMVGEKPVDWSEVSQERAQAVDEVEWRLGRMRSGRDD